MVYVPRYAFIHSPKALDGSVNRFIVQHIGGSGSCSAVPLPAASPSGEDTCSTTVPTNSFHALLSSVCSAEALLHL
jgi:hypothetical protein